MNKRKMRTVVWYDEMRSLRLLWPVAAPKTYMNRSAIGGARDDTLYLLYNQWAFKIMSDEDADTWIRIQSKLADKNTCAKEK